MITAKHLSSGWVNPSSSPTLSGLIISVRLTVKAVSHRLNMAEAHSLHSQSPKTDLNVMSLISSSCTGGRATQQLTHKRTQRRTQRRTHCSAHPRTEGGSRSTQTMCSDPARPLHIQNALPASAETPVLIPSSWLCLSAHLCVFKPLISSFILPFLHFHILLAKERTFPFFKNPLRLLRPISASLKFFHVLVPSLREPSPAGAHYRRA